MPKNNIVLLLFFLFAVTSEVSAACTIMDGEKKTPFDGKDLMGVSIEKKSLIELNKEYPDLNVIERVFKGELQTCSNCTEKHIVCLK